MSFDCCLYYDIQLLEEFIGIALTLLLLFSTPTLFTMLANLLNIVVSLEWPCAPAFSLIWYLLAYFSVPLSEYDDGKKQNAQNLSSAACQKPMLL